MPTKQAPKRKRASSNSRNGATAPRVRKPKYKRKELGEYIVADQAICHGKPTFKGTRVMVHLVLEMVADGMDWDEIVWNYYDRISKDGIAEAVRLGSQAMLTHERLPCPSAPKPVTA